MAVRISNFEIAADDAEKVDIAENVVELQHGAGRFSLWRKPTAGQYTMFQLRTSRSSGFEQARGLDRFFSALVLTPAEAVENDRLDADGVTYAQRVKDGDEAVGMEFFLEMIERGVMDDDVLIAMLREVVEIHSGFPYLVAARLVGWAREEWPALDGRLASRGVDPFALELRRFLNLIYAELIRNADPEGREEIDTALNAGISAPSQEESDEEYQARYAAEMAQFQQLSGGDRMPTIGRAEITVVYDGKDLPRQARELGEESGESFGEEHANAADKEIKDGLDDTLKDAEKRSGESGDRGGKNFGVKYSDAADKVMKQRLSKTADDVAKVFTDDKGIEKFVQGYKGAGTATDDLREKLDSLHESNVIGSKDYDELGGKLQGYVRELEVAKRSIVDQKDAHVEAYERINEMIEVNSKARDRLHDQIDLQAKQATDAIDQSVDRQVEAYEKKYGPAIDAAGERVKTLGERVDVASKKGNDGSLSNFLTRLDDFDKNRRLPTVSGDLEKLGDSVEKSGASINRNRGFFGGLADNVGRLGRTLLGDAKTVGTDIEKIGAGVARGGDDAAGATPKFGSLFRTFSSFDPSDNIGQLLALIVAFAPQIAVLASGLAAGLLIIAGGVAALALAVGGGVIGFSNFMGDVGKLPTGVQPAARAVQSFVGDFKDLRSELQEHMFAGLGGEMGKLSTELIPALKKDFGSLGDALHDVLGDMTRDVTSSGFKNDLRDIFAESKPVIRDLGTIARESFGIIGQLLKDVLPDTHDFTKGVADALGKFNEFLRSPEGKRAVQDWLNDAKQVLGKLGDAIGEVAKAFGKLVSNPKNLQDTINSLEELGKAGPALLRTGQNLSTLAAAAVKAIGTLSSIFENASKIADPFLTGLEVTFTAVVTKARTVVDFFRDIFSAGIKNAMDVAGGTVKAFKQITDGDFVGAGKTIADTTAKVKTNLGHVSDAVRSMGSDGDAAFDKLGKSSQNNLTAIANKLGYTGDDAKKFGGRVSEVASAGGVDLADLKTKGGLSMDQLASKLGLTEGAAKTLLTDGLSPASTKGSAALADLKQKAGTNLDGISNSLGLTGKDAKTFKGAVVDSMDDSRAGLQKLAGAKSWDDIYSALASGGSKSRTEFANKIIASANDSGRSIDDLPPKIRSLVEKYGTIPAKKNTDVTLNDQASSKANSIAHAIDSIQNRNVTVAVYYEQHGTNPATGGAKYGAKVGGIMVGGNIVAGGQRLSNGVHAFANGGILRSPLRIGNTLAGEAGAEAIVPLTGSLKQVDRSVRDLAAYARGGRGYATAGPQKVVTVASGAIQVTTPSASAYQVGSSVLERLDSIVGSI